MLLSPCCLHLDDLWTQTDLKQMVSTAEKYMVLPEDIEIEVLQGIMVLLVTVNLDESLATRSYLQPLNGHANVYRYSQRGQQSNVVYYIGKYGACPAAIRDVLPDELHDSTSTVPMMAEQCFPYLSAIISVGVACGIKGEVKLFDVLVSSEVINYEATMDKTPSYSQNAEPIVVLSQLCKLFTYLIQWPNELIIKRLNDNGKQIPNVKSGVILSGPYLLDDPAMKSLVRNFANGVIGIEMGGANLFSGKQEIIARTIIVKAVCDFGDGKNSNVYQPTAAFLAANLVDKCLSHPQAHETLKGSHM